MSGKTKHVIATVVIAVLFGICVGIAIRDNTQAKYLKQVCTESTVGRYRGTEHYRTTSKHLKAYYVINNVRYDTLGMYHGENGSEVPIHYNPNNIAESYCGEEPVRTGLNEAVAIFMLGICFVFLFVGILRKKHLYD